MKQQMKRQMKQVRVTFDQVFYKGFMSGMIFKDEFIHFPNKKSAKDWVTRIQKRDDEGKLDYTPVNFRYTTN